MKTSLLKEIWKKFNEELYPGDLYLNDLAESIGWITFYSRINMSYDQAKEEIFNIIDSMGTGTNIKVNRDLSSKKFDAIYLNDRNIITLSVVNLNIKGFKCYIIITLSDFGTLH